MRLLALLIAIVLLLVTLPKEAAAQDEGGWFIRRFEAVYRIQENGDVLVEERIAVDFGSLEKHGIFRYFFERVSCTPDPESESRTYPCEDGSDRAYEYVETDVRRDGQPEQWDESTDNGVLTLKIGDPDETISGEHTYEISYRLQAALDAYASHDELFWDVTGTWPVPMLVADIRVVLPGADWGTLCFQGYQSSAPCTRRVVNGDATYAATRPLYQNEELTIVAAWQKGLVEVQPPIWKDLQSIDDYYELDAVELGGAGLVGLGAIAGMIALWWRSGRDRRYRTLYYLTNDPSEHRQPLFARNQVVVEYVPPEDLRPAQMGLILDERADTLDVTATIIDLAVRGYLHITEIPKQGWFGSADWEFKKLKGDDDELLPYERKLFNGLFTVSGEEVEMSELKYQFADDLGKVKEQLYKDAMKRKWFRGDPGTTRGGWMFVGIAAAIVGALLTVGGGLVVGRALIFAPLVPLGILFAILARMMPARTAVGSEVFRRVLGFRLYVATAEKRMQEFNEEKNIFARYLPYAIVFGCVDKWARAFEGLDAQAAETMSSWYSGPAAFRVPLFVAGISSFSNSVSGTMASTRSSSGGSGFSGGGGGSSGGGGGGGGGGSW